MAAPDVTANALKCIPTAADTLSLTPANSAWANMAAWVQISASSPAAWTIVGVEVNEPILNVDYEVDIGVGTLGNEVVIGTVGSHAPPTAASGSAWNQLEFRIPIDNVPSSSRVVIRMRKEGTSVTAWTMKLLYYDTVASTVGVTANPTLMAPASASGVTVATDTNAWGDSGWVEVHSGLTDVAALALVFVSTGSDDDYELDIGTGASTFEVVRGTTGIRFRNGVGSRCVVPFCIPIALSGTNRVAVRVRRGKAAASTNIELKLLYVSTADFAKAPSMRTTTAIAAVSADAAALPTIAGANSAWVNSLYVELIASTATAIVLTGVTVDPAAVVVIWEIDISVGAALSEVVVATVADMTHTNAGIDNTIPIHIPVDAIPASSRVAARIRKTGTSVATWGIGIEYVPKPIAA